MAKNTTFGLRRLDFLANLGLFYLIISGLFIIPLCAAFVVVIINGIMDFKYAILFTTVLVLVILLFFLARLSKRVLERMAADGRYARRQVGKNLARREPVQISLLGGLVTVSYGERHHPEALPLPLESHAPLSLPLASAAENDHNGSDIIHHLKELSELNHQGIIDDEEFQAIKTRLIQACEAANR